MRSSGVLKYWPTGVPCTNRSDRPGNGVQARGTDAPSNRLGGDAVGFEVGGEGVEDEVGPGLAVAGENGVDQQVGGAQHRVAEVEALGRLEGIEGCLLGLDDAAGAGLGPTVVSGGACLLGEVGEYLGLAAGGDAQHPAVLWVGRCGRRSGDQRPLHLTGVGSPSAEVVGPCATATACAWDRRRP